MRGCIEYFPQALEYVARISQFGSEKYDVALEEKNWQLLDRYRLVDAAARHLLHGTDAIDGESNFLHLGHAVWNMLAVLQMKLEENVGGMPSGNPGEPTIPSGCPDVPLGYTATRTECGWVVEKEQAQ